MQDEAEHWEVLSSSPQPAPPTSTTVHGPTAVRASLDDRHDQLKKREEDWTRCQGSRLLSRPVGDNAAPDAAYTSRGATEYDNVLLKCHEVTICWVSEMPNDGTDNRET
ncbi:hypothetical protein BDZ97DRAFT_1766446 [Flammula alnicola]|nr:hypothetical protein BDZ97DRAFT_1766446 [Flammula alnicola]